MIGTVLAKKISDLDENFIENQERWDRKLRRVRSYCKPSTVSFMMQVEDAWGDEEAMYRLLRVTVEGKSRKWARKMKRTKVSYEDFVSALWEKAFDVCSAYDPRDTDFLLFETIRVALDNKAKDICAHAFTRQQRFENSTVQLKEKNEPGYTVTDAIDDRLLVEAILSSPALSDDEHATLRYIYAHPDDSYRDVASALGMASHTTLRRQLDRVRRKLHIDD